MGFTEENNNNIVTVDVNELVEPKKRGRPKGTTKKAVGKTTVLPETLTDPVTEKKKLQDELIRLADYNESIVTKPVNDKVAKMVEDMDIEELKARIRVGKRKQSGKMDNNVAEQLILVSNQLTGRMLDCLEELNESSLKDELLKECTKEYLCMNILDYIPHELKIGGLYGSHVASAYYKSSERKGKTNLKELKPNEVEEAKEKISREMETNPEFKAKMEQLKEKMKGINLPF